MLVLLATRFSCAAGERTSTCTKAYPLRFVLQEDLLIHGDSVYDIIEKQDHANIQAELSRSPTVSVSGLTGTSAKEIRTFLCRMNVSRNARRQMRFGDQKVVLVQGHFAGYLPLCSRNEPVFLALCTPVAMPETRECVVQGSTHVFTSIHSMDMKILHLDRNGEFHLGYQKSSLQGVSWYELVHWDHLTDAQSKHKLITQNEQERSCILLLRLQSLNRGWIWIHCVLQVKDATDSSQQPVIVCTNQVLSEREAYVMRQNSWLYQYYSLHSKMSYNLGYSEPPVQPPSPPAHVRPPAQYSASSPTAPTSSGSASVASVAPVAPSPQYAASVYNTAYLSQPQSSASKWTPQALQGVKRSASPSTDERCSPAMASPLTHPHVGVGVSAVGVSTMGVSGHQTHSSNASQTLPHYPQPIMHHTSSIQVPQFTELTPPGGGCTSAYPYGSLTLATAATAPVFQRVPAPSTAKYHQYHHPHHFDEEAAALGDVEQSLTPTNTEEVSQLISAANYLRSVPRPTYIEPTPLDPYHFSLAYPKYSELPLHFDYLGAASGDYHRSLMPPPPHHPALLCTPTHHPAEAPHPHLGAATHSHPHATLVSHPGAMHPNASSPPVLTCLSSAIPSMSSMEDHSAKVA
ncbi:neuronal PAS domain-containing protein 4-like [Tropilaelaps mercedesae]|uniref:Neuronal PAS domain-containing protein 4-like n=1 Tax=Tropilaelaps mercedesae TaxID=418985 RepID=A0A1V9XQC7_9ACAR|nr:neuronal PAS domain-containing protein 4-like [Tropilaelaps mercedesae]